MIRAALRRRAATWAVLLGCGFALVRCGHEQVAGSSVTTGNPTEIQVSFTGEDGSVAVAGRVEIYGATQIPVPGFRPEPLKSFEVSGTGFTLDAGHFEGIADSLWAEGSRDGDSIARFNLVITGDGQGAILRELVFRIKEGEFARMQAEWNSRQGEVAHLDLGVVPLVEFKAEMDTGVLNSRRVHYLFLYGTGFQAMSASGTFTFPALPAGVHSPAFVSLPTREAQASSPVDSVNVYNLDRPIQAGSNTILRGAIEARVPVPEALP